MIRFTSIGRSASALQRMGTVKPLSTALVGHHTNARGPPSFNCLPSQQTLAAASYLETIRLAARTCISKMRWRLIILAALLTPGAVGGWITCTMFAANGVGFDGF